MSQLVLRRPLPPITDTLVHAPPTTGVYPYSPPYGTWKPGQAGFLAIGDSYYDPVFGPRIRRLTNDQAHPFGAGDLYVRNGWWNADATYIVNTFGDETVGAVHAGTGAVKPLTNAGGAQRADASCSPVNADVFYYFSGTQLKQQLISSGVISTVKDFGATLGSLGGSVDWIDNTDRYMLVNLGSPSFRIWDKQTDTLYTGAVTDDFGEGYAGLAPDARGMIVVNGTSKKYYAITHGTQTLATTGSTFYTGGGDHGDLICPSDGNLYFLRINNDNTPSFMERINVETAVVVACFTFPSDAYYTATPEHVSAVSRGSLQDWVFCSSDIEGGPTLADDNFTALDPVATWGKMENEIFTINVLTGAIRRLAHTRAREISGAYTRAPRVCASWDGAKIAYASNYGYNPADAGYADLYAITP